MATLYVVATPIGNLEDITIRALRILLTVPYIACEDTRRTGLLLSELKKRFPELTPGTVVAPQFIRLDEHKEMSAAAEVIQLLEEGQDVALVSDAGTPLISDPGYILVSHARKRDIPVVAIPGASALLVALTSSGLPVNSFTFLGFAPEKQSSRKKLFASVSESHKTLNSTYIFYCAPHKLVDVLNDMQTIFGDINVTLARELTKIHEEIKTSSISHHLAHVDSIKGEYVILFTIHE